MKRWGLYVPLVIFVAVAVLLWRGLSLDPNYMPSALENKPLPAFKLVTLDGNEVSQVDMTGDIAIVNVWATWCPSCHVEHAYLNELATRGVIIFGVNYKDDLPKARQWLAQRGDPYRFNIADEEGLFGLDLGVTGAPETYLIDANGVVRLRYQGPLSERVWQQEFAPRIAKLNGAAG